MLRVLGIVQRCPPESHDGVADELVQAATVPEDHLDLPAEVAVQQLDHLLRSKPFGQRRETADIGEQDGDVAALPGLREAPARQQVAHHVRVDEPSEEINRFEPLDNPRLTADIKELGAKEGVTVDKVLVADASRRTTTANAYVSGLGPTKRVVFYDTILDGRFTQAELESVAAHELGHVKNRDQLMDAAYGEHIYVDDRTIDSHIKRLRKKFKNVDGEFAQIETLYGVGYRYRDR